MVSLASIAGVIGIQTYGIVTLPASMPYTASIKTVALGAWAV